MHQLFVYRVWVSVFLSIAAAESRTSFFLIDDLGAEQIGCYGSEP